MNLLTNCCLLILKLDPSGHEALPDPKHLGCPQQQKDALSQLSQGAPCTVQPGLLPLVGPFASPEGQGPGTGPQVYLSIHCARLLPSLGMLELRAGTSGEPMSPSGDHRAREQGISWTKGNKDVQFAAGTRVPCS